jgi:hypothetical protein
VDSLTGYFAKHTAHVSYADRLARAIAGKLNGEGFSTPRRCKPFTTTQVWQLLFRYGLTRKPESERLGLHERQLSELAKELGVSRQKLGDWVAKGWAHGRRTPAQGLWIVWADADEMNRLRQLKARSKRGTVGYPIELTTPKNKPAS